MTQLPKLSTTEAKDIFKRCISITASVHKKEISQSVNQFSTPSVVELDLSQANQFTLIDLQKHLESCPKAAVQSINLENIKLGDQAAGQLASIISKFERLEYLNLGGNRLISKPGKREGIRGLALAFKTIKSPLKFLSFANNAINGEIAIALLEGLFSSKNSLEILDFSKNIIDDDASYKIAQFIDGSNLKKLNLYGNYFSEEARSRIVLASPEACKVIF